jgi:TfoX/Sxy family transcriptional regulator of competence genes
MEFVADQMQGAGLVSFRKMFGEYAVYCDGRVVALVCDNQLFVKPTEAGRKYIGEVELAPPYPSARMHFNVTDHLDDREWITELIRVTAGELPLPVKKKKKT